MQMVGLARVFYWPLQRLGDFKNPGNNIGHAMPLITGRGVELEGHGHHLGATACQRGSAEPLMNNPQ